MAKKGGGSGTGSGIGGSRFGDPFDRNYVAAHGHFPTGVILEQVGATVRPPHASLQAGLIHHWEIRETRDPSDPSGSGWMYLLMHLSRVLRFRKKKYGTADLLENPALLAQTVIRFGDLKLSLADLKADPSLWPADTGIVVRPSGPRQLAMVAYRAPDVTVITILEEIPLEKVIQVSGMVLIKTFDDLDRAKLAELGNLGTQAIPFAHFSARMDTAATAAGIDRARVVMIAGSSPRRSKKSIRWDMIKPCRVEERDWDRLSLLWLASRQSRSDELLTLFAVDGAKHTATPLSRLLGDK